MKINQRNTPRRRAAIVAFEVKKLEIKSGFDLLALLTIELQTHMLELEKF